MNLLPGWHPSFISAAPTLLVGRRFNGVRSATAGGGTTAATFGATSFGPEQGDRLIVCAASCFSFPQTTPIAATIAGVAATLHANVDDGLANLAIFSATVPAGASGDVIVTYDAAIASSPTLYRIASYSLYGLESAVPIAAASDVIAESNAFSVGLDITGPAGIVIAGAMLGGSNSPTWTGVTLDVADATLGTTASAQSLATETPRTVTVQASGTVANDALLVAASWA
jgi:hypothetical protein